jgi:hypothetical protein
MHQWRPSIRFQPAFLIQRDAEGAPRFRIPSAGGWFNGLGPDYPVDIIQSNWVAGAHIVCVGKAAGLVGLRRRLRQLIDFGCGKPVPHRGGRLLWHLQDSDELLVRWRIRAPHQAERAETTAITDFKRSHRGLRPLANMNK